MKQALLFLCVSHLVWASLLLPVTSFFQLADSWSHFVVPGQGVAVWQQREAPGMSTQAEVGAEALLLINLCPIYGRRLQQRQRQGLHLPGYAKQDRVRVSLAAPRHNLAHKWWVPLLQNLG